MHIYSWKTGSATQPNPTEHRAQNPEPNAPALSPARHQEMTRAVKSLVQSMRISSTKQRYPGMDPRVTVVSRMLYKACFCGSSQKNLQSQVAPDEQMTNKAIYKIAQQPASSLCLLLRYFLDDECPWL